MKKLILASILTLISAFAFAAAVTVNGNSCGSWSKLTYTPAGDLSLTTDGACGTVAPPPVEPPPVVTPPTSCPSGVTCIDRPFPVIPQEILGLKAGQTLAVRVTVPPTGAGYISTMITTGDTASRRVSLSSVAGDMNPPSSRCASTAWETTGIGWTAGEGTARTCYVKPGTAYINVQVTNCEPSKTCKFWLKGN